MRDVLGARKRECGTAISELALLFPILLVLFLGLVQLVIYMQSQTAVQYAAFAAARAFQVYGDKTLKDIAYPRVRELPYTNEAQTIAEAAAEKVIFESLLWEHKRIAYMNQGGATGNNFRFLDRYYEDGIQTSYGGASTAMSNGVVKVNFTGCTGPGQCDSGAGTEVTYCLPIVFPAIDFLFTAVKANNPCSANSSGRSYSGISISYSVPLPREPVEL